MRIKCKCGNEVELTYDPDTFMYVGYCKCGRRIGVGTLQAVERFKDMKRRKKTFLVEARIIN